MPSLSFVLGVICCSLSLCLTDFDPLVSRGCIKCAIFLSLKDGSAAGPLKFLTQTFKSSRHLAQKALDMVATLLYVMPRVNKVNRILNARVPIVSFHHELCDLACDISFDGL